LIVRIAVTKVTATRRDIDLSYTALALHQTAATKNQPQINWPSVRRVLVVRLRSIGDTVLATPSLIALKRFLPNAQIDILLEDWVAPILEGFDEVDNVITVSRKDTKSRFQTALKLRRSKYDVAFNLHGGTTAGFFVRATGARYRIGFEDYQYQFLYNQHAPWSASFWQAEFTHSAEQQLALLGHTGIPVRDRPKTRLVVTPEAAHSIERKLSSSNSAFQIPHSAFALLHPVAAFDTKQWSTENFARTAEFLHERNLPAVAIATAKEREVLEKLKQLSAVPVTTFDDLSLPEITALASRATLFVGNDSGIAHIAAAVNTPSVVVFGSSNINHWRPWTDAPNEIVQMPMPCQPCAGYYCKEFDKPRCILGVKTESVFEAIDKVLSAKPETKHADLISLI
jgi:lipopolysaccharide heptosyltransferase II